MADTYTCGICRQTFTKGRSDADAAMEFEALWSQPLVEEEADLVCEDCHSDFLSWARQRHLIP